MEECSDPLIILEGKGSSRGSPDTSMSLQCSVSFFDGMGLMREYMILSVNKSRFLHPIWKLAVAKTVLRNVLGELKKTNWRHVNL